jgi:hypothetical protein
MLHRTVGPDKTRLVLGDCQDTAAQAENRQVSQRRSFALQVTGSSLGRGQMLQRQSWTKMPDSHTSLPRTSTAQAKRTLLSSPKLGPLNRQPPERCNLPTAPFS